MQPDSKKIISRDGLTTRRSGSADSNTIYITKNVSLCTTRIDTVLAIFLIDGVNVTLVPLRVHPRGPPGPSSGPQTRDDDVIANVPDAKIDAKNECAARRIVFGEEFRDWHIGDECSTARVVSLRLGEVAVGETRNEDRILREHTRARKEQITGASVQLWCGCQHKSTPRSVHADETAHCTCCRRRPHDYNLSSSIGGGKWRAAPGPAARSRDGVHTNALTQALPTARASTPRASSPHHWRPCGHRVTSSRVSLWRTDGLLGPALSARPPGDVPQWLSVSRPAGMSPRAGRNLIIPLPFQSISTRPSPTPESIGGSGLRNTTASGPLHRTHLI